MGPFRNFCCACERASDTLTLISVWAGIKSSWVGGAQALRSSPSLLEVKSAAAMSAMMHYLFRLASERSYFFSPSIHLPPNALGAVIITLPSWLSLAFAPIANLHRKASRQFEPPTLSAWYCNQLSYAESAPEAYLLALYMLLGLSDSTQPSLEIAWNQVPFILGMSWSRNSRAEREASTKPRLAAFVLFDHGVPVLGYWWQSGRLLHGVSVRLAAQMALFGTALAMMGACRAFGYAVSCALKNWRKGKERQKEKARRKESHQKEEALRQTDKMTAARDRALQREAKEAREAKNRSQASQAKAKQQTFVDAKAKQQLLQVDGKARQRARKPQQPSAAAPTSTQETKAKADAAASAAAAEAAATAEAGIEADSKAEAEAAIEVAAEITPAALQAQVAEPAQATPPVEASKQEEAAQTACADECVICMDAAPTHAAVPCGHRCLCAECSAECNMVCPMCREECIMFIRVF